MSDTPPSQADVVVIGAGPAGVMAAAVLHKAGHDVCVVEREIFPRFVIGESLLPRCLDLLEEIGLLDVVKEQEYMKKRGAVFLRGHERCSFDFSQQYTAGYTHAYQVPRDHFDNVLATGLQAQGVPIHFGHTVTDVRVGASPRVSVKGPSGEDYTVDCKFVIDASGYGRVLPRLLDLNVPSDLPVRRSVFTHTAQDRRPEGEDVGNIWIVSHSPDAWTWIIPFSGGRTSIGVVGTADFFDDHPAEPAACLRSVFDSDPNTRERLGGANFLFEPTVIDGYSIGVKQLWGEGYCLVGNATEFLDPVFSAGVTLAMESAGLAAKVLVRQLSGESVDWDADYATPLLGGIDIFRHYVNWWYDGSLGEIFFSPDAPQEVKRKLCSVLAGYAWDETNSFVRDYTRKVPQVLRLLARR